MAQDADNWQMLQDLFYLAEATPAAVRERVLAERCADTELCRRAMEIFNASSREEAEAEASKIPTLAGKIGRTQ
jgi:hypothetical protein